MSYRHSEIIILDRWFINRVRRPKSGMLEDWTDFRNMDMFNMIEYD